VPRIWHPNGYYTPLLMLHMVVISGIFLLSVPHFLLLISFLFTSHFIPSGPILLSLYFFNFLVPFFFFKHLLLYFPYLLYWHCTFFSYSSSCHPVSYCLNYELHIQSLSRTFNDCLLLVLPICVLFKRPHCLLRDD